MAATVANSAAKDDTVAADRDRKICPMAPSGISINKPAAVIIVVLVAGGIIFYRWGWSSTFGNKGIASGDSHDIDVGKLADYPALTEADMSSFQVTKTAISVGIKGKTLTINSQQTSPEKPILTILLLHGQAFTSNNWVLIKTLQLLAKWGYKAVAVDLPGYGDSKETLGNDISKEEFMSALVGTLDTKPVIISPSMSGSFSLPYIFADPAQSSQRVSGFVPVAPVGTEKWVKNYSTAQVPTLIVYGSKDTSLGTESVKNLRALPKSQIVVIPDAGHPCYIDKPDLWHKALYYFLTNLKK